MEVASHEPKTLLFHELQALLLHCQVSHNDTQSVSALSSSPACRKWLENPAVVRELEIWWAAAPPVLHHHDSQQSKTELTLPMNELYQHFYQQLAHGIARVTSTNDFAQEELMKAMTTDFYSDTSSSSTLSDELHFKRSITVLALTARDSADPPQSAESFASRLHALYEATFTTDSSSAAVKLSPQRKAKQRSLSNNERSLTRSTNSSRKDSKLGKVIEIDKPEPNTNSGSGPRVKRSASAVLPLSNSLAAIESLGKRKKSTLAKQHTDSRVSVSQSIAEPLDETQASTNDAQVMSDNIALRIEKQSSVRKRRQSSNTKIMAGTDLSSTLSKQPSDARLARVISGLSRMNSDLSAHSCRSLEHHLSSLSLHDPTASSSDNSSHFFSIETRLELKERLVELQKQLGDLLVRTKLAWMKCFAEDSQPHGAFSDSSCSPHHHVASREALMAASELVTKGEHLMTMLHSAFAKAMSTTNCPIKEYQDLVESVEVDFCDFQELVRSIAQRSFPLAPVATQLGVQESSSLQHKEPRLALAESATKSALVRPVSYDLPSMKSYCAKVAPPYSSYLTSKK